jgi:nucleoside-diphosphate-sugar epimerase
MMLEDQKILVAGATGQIAGPIAENFSQNNEVWCAARFSDPARKAELDMGSGEFSTMP